MKMLTIERCFRCPNERPGDHRCRLEWDKGYLPCRMTGVPDWCPLSDAPGLTQADIMPQWDEYAGMLRRGEGGSLPRDWFENLLDALGVPLEKPDRA